MASVKHAISEHDTVVLQGPVGAWPAGTCGVVVSVYDDAVLVEIAGPGGETLGTVSIAAEQLRINNV